jgi:tetrahedral aminopeptidase
VQVGDLVTMKRELVELKGGLVSGKAMDNRASVAAVAVCLEELSRLHHRWDVYAVATVQEEVGLKGAITSAFGLEPDVGLAIDVTFGKQPGTPDEYTYELGKGSDHRLRPELSSQAYRRCLVNTAKSLEMPHHLEPAARPAGTDAAAIQISRQGIPTA